jgi:hypothetical protein
VKFCRTSGSNCGDSSNSSSKKKEIKERGRGKRLRSGGMRKREVKMMCRARRLRSRRKRNVSGQRTLENNSGLRGIKKLAVG